MLVKEHFETMIEGRTVGPLHLKQVHHLASVGG